MSSDGVPYSTTERTVYLSLFASSSPTSVFVARADPAHNLWLLPVWEEVRDGIRHHAAVHWHKRRVLRGGLSGGGDLLRGRRARTVAGVHPVEQALFREVGDVRQWARGNRHE